MREIKFKHEQPGYSVWIEQNLIGRVRRDPMVLNNRGLWMYATETPRGPWQGKFQTRAAAANKLASEAKCCAACWLYLAVHMRCEADDNQAPGDETFPSDYCAGFDPVQARSRRA